ncbi:MAG: alpha/beta hydrolase [Hyphomonas sp.]|nr:alpha/beta hydrolase [Hyphomonas sp.]
MRRLIALACLIASVCGCASTNALGDRIPEHELLALSSAALGETRSISVHVPPGYEDGTDSYPVLYMPDGGIDEDFPHIVNTVTALVEAGAIRPVIVVGIENTDRHRDLTPASSTQGDAQYAPLSDGAADFRAFLSEELIPQIEAAYRTDGRRAIVGESLAGLFIMDTLFREPDLFDRYVAVDPSLWWDNGRLVEEAQARLPELSGHGTRLWFTASDAQDIYTHTDALSAIMKVYAPADLDWTYAPNPEEHHWTIFRASEVEALGTMLWPPEAP